VAAFLPFGNERFILSPYALVSASASVSYGPVLKRIFCGGTGGEIFF